MTFSRNRSLLSYGKVQAVITRLIRNRSFGINRAGLRRKEYLDVGCAGNLHEGFIHLDHRWQPGIDICRDITRGIPLANHAVKGIFTEHCLEHLPLHAADFVLAEFKRVLKPGGVLRIIVPDGEMYLTRYSEIIRGVSGQALPYAAQDVYDGLYSPIMSVNRIFREHGHLFIYDFITMRKLLEKHGFIDIKKERYGSGRDPHLLKDSARRAVESLYVEARKPEVAEAS